MRQVAGKCNPDNVWKLTTRKGEVYFVKCPSKSGARIYLAGQIGIPDNAPFKADLYLPEQVPEGVEVLQAQFLRPHDPRNWETGRI